MRQVDFLNTYKNSKTTSRKNLERRSIGNRITASYRGQDFFDGDRNNGYGGLVYDGRWNAFASELISNYNLNSESKILQINSEKGYLLFELNKINPKLKLYGIETSEYALENSLSKDEINYSYGDSNKLPYENKSMTLIISLGNVYCLNLKDAIAHLRELERVKSHYSFISLATYESFEDYRLFKDWSLLGNLLLKRDEWIEVLNHANYTGDFQFIDANYLGLSS